jgi:hypothetical protein
MDPRELMTRISVLLWALADSAAEALADPLAGLNELSGETEPALRGKLLEPLTDLPNENALVRLVSDVLGNVTDEGSPVRAHGWRREAGVLGMALVATQGASRAVLAVSPGPVVDLVVTPGATLNMPIQHAPWTARIDIQTEDAWNASFTRGGATVTPVGSAAVTIARADRIVLGVEQGPHLAMEGIAATFTTSPAQPLQVGVNVPGFAAAVLPPALASFLAGGNTPITEKTDLALQASRAQGLHFASAGARVDLPLQLHLPGVSTRRFALELSAADGGILLSARLSLFAKPGALPLSANVDGLGVQVPLTIGPSQIGLEPGLQIDGALPTGMGIDLLLGPVSGGGAFLQRGSGAYAGVVEMNLGIVSVQAWGLLQLPSNGQPLSLLVLLGLRLPYPGIQLGFGFALDAIGGLVGVNRRADDEHLKRLVLDGNADRILFPGNAAERADDIVGPLEACFPVARGRFVVGPMIRINWGGRIVTLSAAVILELPDPVRVVLLGRLVIALPDPAIPLIRLQASVYGRIDPAVPLVEFLISLAGSWIVGIPITGEIYVLFRGGAQATFVLSAGGFHPRYVRPPGLPELRRLTMDLGGGVIGLRAESYLALTSNSLQFGAKVQLDATIAECGVEGWLGLDALFVWEPTLAFAAHVYAGVAVLAFGERLASVGLDFTLEGPAPWHAFGTGTISVLFWDVSLDFDVRWGDAAPPKVGSAEDIFKILAEAIARHDAWTVERPAAQRAGIRLTDKAKTALAKGEVAQPDASLRFNQTVVPLDIPITRFHRLNVEEQTWTVTGVELDGDAADLSIPVESRFVPGEYFAMSDDDQLVRAAFEDKHSGFVLSETDIKQGATHLVNDDYETAYQVEDGWFPAKPPRLRLKIFRALFVHEQFLRPISATERVDRWRLAQRPIDSLTPKVVIAR